MGSGPIRTIVIAGPDGTGKSSVVAALLDGPLHDQEVLRIHHRPRLLPGRATSEGSDRPHASRPYPSWLSFIKVLYLFADHALGWIVRVRPHIRRGGWVLIERGWWDLVVDPARYRLSGGRGAALFARFLPGREVTIVLTAPPEVVRNRKAELPEAELVRQQRTWEERAANDTSVLLVDAGRPLHEVVSDVSARLTQVGTEAEGWIALPSRNKPRWLLPREPSSATRAGLLLFHPVTPMGRLGWLVARALAGAGVLRWGPRASLPARIADVLRNAGVEWTHVAVGPATHRERFTALLLTDKTPVAVAKIALSEDGRRALSAERDALGSLEYMEGLLDAPRVIAFEPGLLVLEAAPWKPRRDPWRLTDEVATAVGEFHRRTGSFHGDFAPWNLLRSRTGWTLIDWEDSGPNYPALFDVFHYLVQGHALLGRPRRSELLEGLDGAGWVGRSLTAYARAAHFPLDDPRRDLSAYLAASRLRIDPATEDGRRGLRARDELEAELRDLHKNARR